MAKNHEKITEFVRKNIVLLTSTSYDKDRIKETKKRFFVDLYKNKFGKPSTSEIAFEVVGFLRKIGRIKSKEDLNETLDKVPFLKKNIHDIDKVNSLFEDIAEGSILTPEDLSKLNQTDYLKKKEDEITKIVIETRASDIDEAMDKKIEEYESIPSVLDSKDFEEPTTKEIKIEETREWWEMLSLTADPFPRQEGLNKIPENLYEQIIYKSKLIQEYINKIESNREKVLNKGILVLGNFGTGKTTFFDYLSYHLIKNKICVLRMTFLPKVDVAAYLSEFETKFYNLLKEIYCKHHGDYCDGPANFDNSKNIMKKLKEDGWSFMVFIDDLHKHSGYEDVVLRFLASLQIVKDDIIRSGMDIGFMVAGLPAWDLKMQKDGALPGFFDASPEILPEVSPDDAHHVINNRLRTYSLNPKRKNIIDLTWIKQIHRQIKNEGLFVHYRLLIDRVTDELRNKNFSILESNYVDVPEDKLELIKTKLKAESVFSLFNNLLKGQDVLSDENKVICFNFIIKLFLNKGLDEESPEFIGSEFYFKKLVKSKIISKLKTEFGFKWILNPDLTSFFDSIVQKYNLYPEDYLKKIFFVSEKKPPTKSKFDILEEIQKFLEKYDGKINASSLGLIKNSIMLTKEYEKVHSEEIDNTKYDRNVDLLVSAISDLSRALFILEKMNNLKPDNQELMDNWNSYWFNPSSVANFINIVWYDNSPKTREKMGYVYLDFKEAFEEIFNHIKVTISLNQDTKILLPYRFLTRDELINLDQLRGDYGETIEGSGFFQIVSELNKLLERKFRNCFFNQFNIIYGNINRRLNMLNNLKEYILKKGVEHSNYFFNEFQNLNRGEYKGLIIENQKLKKDYFRYLFKDWDAGDIESFLSVFCETNIIVSHLKTQKISGENQAYIYRFFLNAIEVISMMNKNYWNLLNDNFYFYIEKDETICCFFSLPGLRDPKTTGPIIKDENDLRNARGLLDIKISLQEINDTYGKLKQYAGEEELYRIDLADFELINNMFSIEYHKFMAILALLIYRTKDKNDDKLRLKVHRLFGSEIILNLKEDD